jgi:hypothetical protein
MQQGFESLPDITPKHNEIHRRAFSDHEEGDWTAGFTCGTSGTITIDPSYKTGHYVKIGKMVTVTGLFKVLSVSSPVGVLCITGLPFICGNVHKYYSSVTFLANGLENTAVTQIVGSVEIGDTKIACYKFAAGVMTNMAQDVKANSEIMISATYFTD